MNWLNPEFVNSLSVGAVLFLGVVGFVFALFRGWIVLGLHHRELMAQNAREIAAKDARSMEDSKSIAKFAEAARVTTVAAEVQQAMVTALREVAQERAS